MGCEGSDPADRNLLACYVGGIDTPHPLWVLREEDNYCYANLPDLTPQIRAALVGLDLDFVSCMFSLVLVHQKRTVARAAKAHRCAIVNLLHGLMLGLYPYNVRKGSFELRVRVAGALRLVMTGDMAAFVDAHPSLVALGVVEYLINVLSDFCPVEYALLQKSAHCRMCINNICEQFRASLALPLDWSQVESTACSLMSAVTRQLKLQCRRLKLRHAVPRVKVPWNINRILNMPVVRGCTSLASIKLLDDSLTFDQLVDVENAWGGIGLYSLPECMLMEHEDRLRSMASNSKLVQGVSCIHVCARCVFQRRVRVLDQTFGLDCATRRVLCTHCGEPSVLVNLVGRVLRVMGVNIRLCCTCLRPCVWSNTRDCDACRRPTVARPVLCDFCDHKNVVHVVKVVDMDSLQLRDVYLCHKHAKHCVLSDAMHYDMRSLALEMCSI